jgi:hypothetical protein
MQKGDRRQYERERGHQTHFDFTEYTVISFASIKAAIKTLEGNTKQQDFILVHPEMKKDLDKYFGNAMMETVLKSQEPKHADTAKTGFTEDIVPDYLLDDTPAGLDV